MKNVIAPLVLALIIASGNVYAASLFGQVGNNHSAQLSWTASVDGGTVTVYRAAASCSTNPTTFTPIKTGAAAAGPYSDATITVGAWCYYVTAVVGTAESIPSNKITLTVLPQPPGGLSGSAN